MVFSSLTFLFIFLPAVLLFYFLLPGIRAKNAVLCLFSLVFYAWGEPVYVLLMIASILLNWLAGLGMERFPRRKRLLLILALVFNLGAIGYFKYAGFFLSSLNALFSLHLPALRTALPIGISFYTFQILSYVIDVYHGRTAAQKNLLSLATYITMFPQLVAGPIVRYETVRDELSDRHVTLNDFTEGLSRFFFGLGKKVLIANQTALVADAVFDTAVLPPAGALWIGALCYAMQIYFDFSGYSDMAIGMGRMFGFHFTENFNYPYIADSVTDFWRRWHISLSAWFREYVYIPLGGNRCGTARHIFNMLVVWLLTGLWHGAAWTFVLWGLYYGLLLILEKHVLGGVMNRIPKAVRRLVTFLLALFGWIIFRSESLSALGRFLSGAFAFGSSGTGAFLLSNANALSPLILLPAAVLGCLPWTRWLAKRFPDSGVLAALRLACAFLVWLASIAMLLGESYNPFIYFRF